MILGLSVAAFTTLHVIISLIAIAAGLVALAYMLKGRFPEPLTALFLVTTIATSVTGFFFHSKSFGPPHIVGVISLVILAVTVFAIYVRKLAGVWRPVYVGTAVAALYFNCFVGVVQSFQKLPPLNALAPTGTEPPFAVAQGLTLLLFIALGVLAARRRRA
jgi:uncharacterized membrane protein